MHVVQRGARLDLGNLKMVWKAEEDTLGGIER